MDTTQSPEWIKLAASHGSTKWVKRFIESYLPKLKDQTLTPETFAQALDQELLSRQLNTIAQQKNYRSNVVQAIKTLDADHPAIALVSPTPEEYRELNDAQRGKLAERETKYFTSDQAQDLVNRADALLDSRDWADVAAALAVLLGRRISEILLSRFERKTAWSVIFSEMAKKKDTDGLTIEIPTLAPADRILKAIDGLQKTLKIEDLRINSLTPKMAKQTVNGRYSEAVAKKCVEHFSDLIPSRADGQPLYTHIFRAVYATIAAHWYCPLTVPEHSYKAEIQGHFTISGNGQKLPNFAARANYDDYASGTEDGNRDGRLGIKLGTVPDLEIIDAFRKKEASVEPVDKDEDKDKETEALDNTQQDEHTITSFYDIGSSDNLTYLRRQRKATRLRRQRETIEPIESTTPEDQEIPPMSKSSQKDKIRRPELHSSDLEEMMRLMAQRGVTGSIGEVFHALVEDSRKGEVGQQTRTVNELTASLNWFTQRIDMLEHTCQELQKEREQLRVAQSASEEVDQLRSENERLKEELSQLQNELNQTRSKLEIAVQQFLGQPNGTIPASTPARHTATAQAIDLSLRDRRATQLRQPETIATTIPPSTVNPPTAPAETSAHAEAGEPKAEFRTQRRRRNQGERNDRIDQCIDALMSWNTAQESSDTQLRISIPTVKSLASAMGANYQPAIQEVMKQREEELKEHHDHLLIGTRHNAGVLQKDKVLQAIARDYLALPNWEDVKYIG